MAIFTYFYHINEARRSDGGSGKLFHHRWFWHIGKRRYSLEVSTGPSLELEFQRGQAGDDDRSCMLIVGALFVTAYFKFPVSERWLLKRKCIATWDNNREFYLTDGREYGFRFYNWAFVWHWHSKVHESSSQDPWWMRQYIHLDELVLGKWEALSNEVGSGARDVWFKLGEKEFKIDSIKWERVRRFRTFIPFALWHQEYYRVDIKIDKPPMVSGKGENSWDCGDDGSFGLSCSWSGPNPSWENTEECARLAADLYVAHVLKDAKRYGGSSGERGIAASDAYEYVGHFIPRRGDRPDDVSGQIRGPDGSVTPAREEE